MRQSYILSTQPQYEADLYSVWLITHFFFNSSTTYVTPSILPETLGIKSKITWLMMTLNQALSPILSESNG